MDSSGSGREYEDEEPETSPVKRDLPILNLQALRHVASPSPSLVISSPKREAEDDLEFERETIKRRRKSALADDGECDVKAYEALFDQEVNEFMGNDYEDKAQDLEASGHSRGKESSQYGAVRWTPEEKAVFFHLLDRRGRHELAAISDGIGTKSEPEVSDYLCRLQDAYRRRHLNYRNISLGHYEDLPAAVEVDEELESALDEAAKLLRAEKDSQDYRREKRLSDEWPVLDSILAKDLAKALKNEDSETESPHPAETGSFEFANALLNVPKMLELSTKVFMNSKDEDDNWRNIADKGETPAIFQTCLVDLSNLIVSLTERIVASTNFMAMSRIRAASYRGERSISQIINQYDVHAALETLRMPFDSWDFWVQCPRKCRLTIHRDLKSRDTEGPELDYDRIEEALEDSTSGRDPVVADALTVELGNEGDTESEEEEEEDEEGADDSDLQSQMSISTSQSRSHNGNMDRFMSTANSAVSESFPHRRMNPSSTSSSAGDTSLEDEEFALEEDMRANITDQNAAEEHSLSLWNTIGLASAGKRRDRSSLPEPKFKNPSLTRRKTAEDLRDWKDFCRYKAEWECYRQPVS